MMASPTIKLPMSEVAKNLTASVRVVGVRRWTFRWWVALKLLALAEAIVPNRVKREPVIEVGDTMQISAALLTEWRAMPGHQSETVRVVDIRVQPDGSKTPYVERVAR